MGADVIPIRPGVIVILPAQVMEPDPRRPRTTPCPVCGGLADPNGFDDTKCDGCGAAIHRPCYWGRVASLSEWREYLALLDGDADDPPWPKTVCAACRAIEGA